MATEFISNSWLMPTNANAEANRVSNYSLDFDAGSSQYIDLGSTSDLDFQTSEMSISFWINSDTASGLKAILGNTNSSASSYQYLIDIHRTVGKISFLTSGPPILTSSLTINTNTWYHVCITKSGTTSNWVYTMYIDGSSSDGGTLSTTTNPPANQTTAIGRYGALSGYYFSGKLTEVSFFDYSLSAPQVTELYGTGSAIGNPMAITNGRKPVAYYPLGNSAFNGEFLTPNGAEQDYVFDFDGTNDYINCGNDSSLNITNNITISAWIKADSFGTYNLIIGKSTNKDYDFGTASIGGNNVIRFHTGDGTQEYVDSSGISLVTGLWYQVAIVRTTTPNQVTFFVNGEQLNTVSLTRTPIGSTDITRIGSRSGSFSFDGSISNVSIFDSALPATGTESVASLYNYGTPPNIASYSNLQGWWELDASATFDGSNWSIPDASSNSNTGTSSGMTAANLILSDLVINQSYDPFSLLFDGTDDRIETSSIDVTGDKSFSFWIKRAVGSASNDGGILTIVPTSGTSDYISIALWQDYIQVQTSNTSTTRRTVEETISTDVWHHIVVIKSTNSIDNIYINGVNKTLSNFGTWTGAIANPQNKISEAVFGVTNYNFNGSLSNVSIYSSELSAAQVKTLYNEGKPFDLNTFAVTPVSWWRLGSVNSSFDGTNWTVLDEISTSGNNGTSANMTQADLVDGVGATGSGTSSGMSSGTNRTGDAPYSENNAVSYNMSVTAKSTSVPT